MPAFANALIQDLIFFSIFIGLSSYLAKKRGRNIFLWGAAGVLIIPFIVLLFLPKKQAQRMQHTPEAKDT